jgi:4-amino-4-deoxy-L-arabinose transferase-like glycosyltransferase
MKSFQNFCEKYSLILVAVACVIALVLHVINFSFPPINSDEASFAYNGYSIAQTGKDEYGAFLPTRFKAFGENKLPVTIYTIATFVKIFGFNEFTSRAPFILIGILSPVLFYLLAKKIFNNSAVAIISAFLAGFSPWIQIMSRHIHENVIILLLTILAMILFVKLINKFSYRTIIYLSLISGIGLFTYHIGKLLAIYFLVTTLVILFFQKKSISILVKATAIFLIPIAIFLYTEFQHPSTRVSNLLFINDSGFTSSIEELRREDNNRMIHNKATAAALTLTNRYLTYFSPEFLVIHGDANARFGFKGISPITPITFVFFLVGIYYAYKNNEKYRTLLISLLFVAPLTASLSWQEYSLTRSFLMIIPILIFASYGIYYVLNDSKKFRWIFVLGLFTSFLFFSYLSWDFYFNHYPKKYAAMYAWQAGYKEVNQFIKENYKDISHFYITNKLGQPYIFTLFYLKYSPTEYQKQARLTDLDEYGFGQVEKFDKFTFNFKKPDAEKNVAYIGYPEEFEGTGISENAVKKITFNGQDIFWIYIMR